MQAIPLKRLARERNPRRKSYRFVGVEPTQALVGELAKIFLWVHTEWLRLSKERLVPIYSPPTVDGSALVLDYDPAQFNAVAQEIRDYIDSRIIYQTDKLQRWVTKYGEWHGRKTGWAVNAATGVQVAPYLTMGDIREELEASIAANVSLIRSLNDETRSRVATVLFTSFAIRRNKRDTIRQLAIAMGTTQKRAKFIAEDQTHKLNVKLTELRQRQLGLNEYIWHTMRDKKVRPLHRAREGQRFSWSKPPSDGHAGHAIGCRCRADPVMEV